MKIKKIACLMLSAALLLCQISVFAAESENNYSPEAVAFVSELGITESTEQLQTEITRREFAKILCRMIRLNDGGGAISGLRDVAADDADMPYIAAMIDMGVFTIDKIGRFYPERSVSEAEALDAFVTLLGYDAMVSDESDRKTAVRILAERLDWMEDIDFAEHNHTANHKLTRGEVTQLCYNVLNSEYYYKTEVSDGVRYDHRKDYTVAEEFFNLTVATGRVVQNYKSGLMTEGKCREDSVKIDDTLYEVGDTDAGKWLGYQVKFWYDAEKTLIYLYPTRQNQTLSIPAERIGDCTRDTIRYYNDDDKTEKVSFAEADVLYNGVALYNYEASDFYIENGTVDLLDYNGDDNYDVVFINTYVPMVVQGIDTANRKIVDSLSQTAVSLDENDFGLLEIFRYEAETETYTEAEFEDIAVEDMVLMYRSKDGQTAKAVLYTNAITGMVTELISDSDEICIDGTNYPVSSYLRKAISNKVSGAPKLEAGRAGIFFVDICGEVVWAQIQDKVNLYGYASAFQVGSGGLQKNGEIRVYTIGNKWENYKLADKVELNGTTEKDHNKIAKALFKDGKFVPQIVRYSLNSENRVTALDVYIDRSAEAGYIGDDADNFTKDAVVTSGRYKTGTRAFGKKYMGTVGRTYVFNVPTGTVSTDGTVDEDRIFCYSMSVFQNDVNYTVEIYDADEFHVAKAILWSGEGAENFENDLFYVNRIVQTVDADGERMYEVKGYLGGAQKSIFCDTKSGAASLKSGDICKIALLPDKSARTIEKVFTLDADAANANGLLTPTKIGEKICDSKTSLQGSAYAAYVTDVYAVNTSGINLLAYTSGGTPETFCTSGVGILKYNYENKCYEPATIYEIVGSKYDSNNTKLFVHERYSTAQDMVIFNPEVK